MSSPALVGVAVKITFRPTSRQVLGRALFIAALACAVALLPAVAYMSATGRWHPAVLSGIGLAVVALAVLVALRGARRVGVVLDRSGVHPIAGRPDRYARWTRITDIRAERRGGRTVPVVYLHDPAQPPWRLRAPYSGRALAADDELDMKIFVMRSLWESYKGGEAPRGDPRSLLRGDLESFEHECEPGPGMRLPIVTRS
ncbi:hypothetical protein [Glycomyces xiaoerkulensis]|uniref:hypothetical protein n=1 Tax=Glycomyces xiaoerkulensis TaxID=2038139 RepID=UPI000C25D882|nr:hypothetical protein [Glycomyces xiaoerkulensis]